MHPSSPGPLVAWRDDVVPGLAIGDVVCGSVKPVRTMNGERCGTTCVPAPMTIIGTFASVATGAAAGTEGGQAEVDLGRAEVALIQAQRTHSQARLLLSEQIGVPLDEAVTLSSTFTVFEPVFDVGELVAYLFETAGALGAKLGPLLFQLPPYMKKDLDRLRAFLDLVPAERRVALEFRNASWFEDDVFEALRAKGAALCFAETKPDDKEGGNETVPLVATARFGYLRLRRENYTDADLAAWAGRMGGQGWSEAYVFFKHEDDGTAPKFALRLMEIIGASAAPAGVE